MKKVLALVMAMMLLVSGVLAESVSKTTTEVTVIETIEDLVIEPVVEQESQIKVLTAITEVAESGKPVVTYFPAEVQAKIVEQVKANILANIAKQIAAGTASDSTVNVDEMSEEELVGDLELVEFISLAVVEYKIPETTSAEQAIEVKLTCATKFDKDAQLVVLLGLYDAEGEVEWVLADCEAGEDGSVALQLTVEQLKAMQAATAVTVAILTK